ncbi:exo-alpha-sialidase [Naasia sp. SYSU D00057]|uniref:exo-alpha-sialidase n=1 Tax=Naasia sp. SYSU D00057 TaxID=2817380 RepID=UPI001B316A45|nr:exo-alpha-sialidase [Naasia sp. SYSU D00057]
MTTAEGRGEPVRPPRSEILADAGAEGRSAAALTVDRMRAQVTDKGHAAFPGLALLPDGRLVAAWRQAEAHMPPSKGVIELAYSADGGGTWTEPRVVVDDPSWDVRDASLAVLDGVLHLSFFKHNGVIPTGCYVVTSADGGATWSAPSRIGNLARAATCAPLVRSRGTVYAVYYGRENGSQAFDSAFVSASRDGGGTWSERTVIARGVDRDYQEPYLVDTGDALVCLFRYGNAFAIGRSVSLDGGRTWSEPAPVVARAGGKPAVACTDGTLIALYRRLPDGAAVARRSHDLGLTWSAEVFVDSAAVWMSYAAPAVLEDGVTAWIYGLETDMGRGRSGGESRLYVRYLLTSGAQPSA